MIREYPERPVVGVGVVVWRGPELLLVQRGKAPRLGQWSIPGGAQELGETLAEAARREVLEEAGIRIGDLTLVDVVDAIERSSDGRVLYHYTLVDFTTAWQGGELRAGGDAAAAAWVKAAELAQQGLWPETSRIIARAAALHGGPALDPAVLASVQARPKLR